LLVHLRAGIDAGVEDEPKDEARGGKDGVTPHSVLKTQRLFLPIMLAPYLEKSFKLVDLLCRLLSHNSRLHLWKLLKRSKFLSGLNGLAHFPVSLAIQLVSSQEDSAVFVTCVEKG